MTLREYLTKLPPDCQVSVGETTGYYLFSTPAYLLEHEDDIMNEFSRMMLRYTDDVYDFLSEFSSETILIPRYASLEEIEAYLKNVEKIFGDVASVVKKLCTIRKKYLKCGNILDKKVKEHYPTTAPGENAVHIIVEGSISAKYWMYEEFVKDHPDGIDFQKLFRTMFGTVAYPKKVE